MSTMFAQPALPHTLTGPPSPPSPLQHLTQPTSPLTYSTTTTPPAQNQYTPPSSTETTKTSTATTTPLSPISPRTSWHIPHHLQQPTRQIRQRQGPLYVPAVLRPTEKPARSSPPKPGAGYHGSAESFEEYGGTGAYGGERPLGAGVLSRIVTEEWNEDVLGPVTGSPSRNHWKPDTASTACDDATCTTPFTFFNRRHHCRRCGRIFCFSHSTHLVPLDQHARFHPQAPKHRACNSCWSDYRTWEGARGSRSNSEGSSRDGTVPGTPGGVPWPIKMAGPRGEGGAGGMKAPASVAKSVPRDWSWSTF